MTESGKKRFSLKDLSLFRLGAFIWLIGTLLGYYFYRTGGKEFYKEGYSLPLMLPMGIDFNAVYSYGIALRESISAYLNASSIYPPFVTVALLPLTLFPPAAAYHIYVVFLTIALFCMIYACLAENESLSAVDLVFQALVITLFLSFSYPVNFALERGNSDLLAGAFAALSLFAMTRGWFFFSIITLTAGTQFKIYPVILCALLFKRFGYRSIIWFLAANAAAFLILGVPAFLQFAASLSALAGVPSLWEGNHSLYAYVARLEKEGFIPAGNLGPARNFSYLIFFGMFCFAWLKSWLTDKERSLTMGGGPRYFSGSEIGLIGMGFCLMSLIPSVSYDYKLAIQVVPFLILLARSESQLFDSAVRARVVAALAAALMALTLLPRNLVARVKTPWLILLFLLYFYLALSGKAVCPDKSAGKNGG
ncbi:MAG: hypothetical protein A2X28_01830 [Elusimicrobia bacterium GWA2_56_46]|nr:MAG: hypothetical protein A2X28_01830 [Elusimicrobia bacterium GWA2_56_46]OGR55487.1 MAG: hypothetical protein A2X39_01135 [Elusimicrobia bacterium GWC2_56_31]HBW21958.1 hypothetical protein [Elusimicrobiota bacterium]